MLFIDPSHQDRRTWCPHPWNRGSRPFEVCAWRGRRALVGAQSARHSGGGRQHRFVLLRPPVLCRSAHTRPEHVWGVIDIQPKTDFPDLRTKTYFTSKYGPVVQIPREGNTTRLYTMLDSSVFLNESGRVDKSKANPQILMNVCTQCDGRMCMLIRVFAEHPESVWSMED
jgi:hypothetical protein